MISKVRKWFEDNDVLTIDQFRFLERLQQDYTDFEITLGKKFKLEIEKMREEITKELEDKYKIRASCPRGGVADMILAKLQEDDTGFTITELAKALEGSVKETTIQAYLPKLIKQNLIEASNGRPKLYYAKGATASAMLKNANGHYSTMG